MCVSLLGVGQGSLGTQHIRPHRKAQGVSLRHFVVQSRVVTIKGKIGKEDSCWGELETNRVIAVLNINQFSGTFSSSEMAAGHSFFMIEIKTCQILESSVFNTDRLCLRKAQPGTPASCSLITGWTPSARFVNWQCTTAQDVFRTAPSRKCAHRNFRDTVGRTYGTTRNRQVSTTLDFALAGSVIGIYKKPTAGSRSHVQTQRIQRPYRRTTHSLDTGATWHQR